MPLKIHTGKGVLIIDIHIKARCLTAESLTSSPAAILSQTGFLAGSVVSDVRNTLISLKSWRIYKRY